MNTLLNPAPEYTQPTELRRLNVLDRLALYGGLALIRWARRDRSPAIAIQPRPVGVPHRTSSLDDLVERRELVEARHRLTAAHG